MTRIEILGLAVLAILLTVAGSAFAGSNCYQLGSNWVCNGDNWNTQTYSLGNNRITNGTVRDPYTGQSQSFTRSCYWLGGNYVCN